jgi:hypothetical protein
MRYSTRLALFFILLFTAGFAHATTTWFVRVDGGTRFSSAVTTGQCDGQADVAYPGSGTNQHCAFNDFRYLWSDNSGNANAWVIVGGDIVVIRGCTHLSSQQNPSDPDCRIGYDNDNSGAPPNEWCGSGNPNSSCFPPPIPSGTSGAHTQILGGCAYGTYTCTPINPTDQPYGTTNETQLFGGMGLVWTLQLQGSSFVDIEGIELTTHNKVDGGTAFANSNAYTLGQTIFDGTNTQSVTTAGTSQASGTPSWNGTIGGTTTSAGATFTNLGPNCITTGTPAYPISCSGGVPYDDFAANGIRTDNAMHDILLQDVWIHGFSSSGIYGPLGGLITMTRVNSSYNAFAGWNFDLGPGGPNSTGFPNAPTSTIVASYVTMDFNGYNQEYPITHTYPALIGYSILDNGFGDAWSGQNSFLASMSCDHCEMAWNVKDAFFGPHTSIGHVTITNSYAGNNGGQTWKANLGGTGTWLMQNTVTNDNCRRNAQPLVGAPSTYNQGINNADRCRADGSAIAVVWPVVGSFELDNNSFTVASQNVAFDFACFTQPTAVSVANGGSGANVNDILWVGAEGTVKVTSVGGGGVVTGVSLLTAFQAATNSAPFSDNYVYDATTPSASGIIITISAVTPVTCGGGGAPRIMRNNTFNGYTNPNNISWNGLTITFICYSACQGNAGDSDDTQWTIRSNNNMWNFKSGAGACTYSGETCVSPGLVVQPSQTWVSETQLDSFNPHNASSGDSFYPASGSLLTGAGVTISGITADYFGVTRPSPPAIGAVEFATGPPPITRSMMGHIHIIGNRIIHE